MSTKNVITIILALITLIIPVYLYLSPPQDVDGGPMMAYNFMFFYPLSILAFILGIITVFRIKSIKEKILLKSLLSLCLVPVSLLMILIIINIVTISNEPESLNLDYSNTFFDLHLNDTLTVKLSAFNKEILDDANERINVYTIKLIPYLYGKYSFKDGGEFISRRKKVELYYLVRSDTMYLLSEKDKFSYFNKRRIDLPIKIQENIEEEVNLDSLLKLGYKKFKWKY